MVLTHSESGITQRGYLAITWPRQKGKGEAKGGIRRSRAIPGTGKTHLALAIGLTAVRQGHKVYCTSVKRLAKDVALAKASHSLDTFFKRMLSCRLWILDDWGVVSLGREASEEIFDLLDRRKHAAAMIITSNRAVEEWPEVFPDPVIAAAAIDRMFDRAEAMLFSGDSYRLKGRIDSKIVDRGE